MLEGVDQRLGRLLVAVELDALGLLVIVQLLSRGLDVEIWLLVQLI